MICFPSVASPEKITSFNPNNLLIGNLRPSSLPPKARSQEGLAHRVAKWRRCRRWGVDHVGWRALRTRSAALRRLGFPDLRAFRASIVNVPDRHVKICRTPKLLQGAEDAIPCQRVFPCECIAAQVTLVLAFLQMYLPSNQRF